MKIELSVEQFRTAATIGLGRAILHLRQTGEIPDKDLILHLMLHNTAYDPQIEGYRGWYTFELLQASGQAPSYIQKFWEALKDIPPKNSRDERHRMELIGYFADAGDPEADKQLFDRTAANIAVGSDAGVYEAVERHRVAGAEFVLDRYRKAGQTIPNFYYSLIFGADESEEILNLPGVRELADQEKRRADRSGKREEIGTYQDFKTWVTRDPIAIASIGGPSWARWAREASDKEIRQVAEDLTALPTDDYDRILAYLSFFTRRAFPLDPAILIDMARQYTGESLWTKTGRTPQKLIPVRAFFALEKIRHPDVRAFAIEWLRESRGLGYIVCLLEQNYQPGDWNLISSVLNPEHSPEILHGLGRGIRDVFEVHPEKEALLVLQFMIEHGPCSFCRYFLVEGMHQLGGLPELMRVEATFDSYGDIREWAEGVN